VRGYFQDHPSDEPFFLGKPMARKGKLEKENLEQNQESGSRKGSGRDRMAFTPGRELGDRIRNFIYWTPGASLNQFLLEAAQREIERMEKILNQGKPWPVRKGQLKPGRPISS
jgi:hypothetical protein